MFRWVFRHQPSDILQLPPHRRQLSRVGGGRTSVTPWYSTRILCIFRPIVNTHSGRTWTPILIQR